jgi:hypothetical protein
MENKQLIKVRNKIKRRQKVQDREISDTLLPVLDSIYLKTIIQGLSQN